MHAVVVASLVNLADALLRLVIERPLCTGHLQLHDYGLHAIVLWRQDYVEATSYARLSVNLRTKTYQKSLETMESLSATR